MPRFNYLFLIVVCTHIVQLATMRYPNLGIFTLLGTTVLCDDPACSPDAVTMCVDETSCTTATGVWVPVANATYIPGTALVGGRRYVMGQNDREFTHTISAPNGGYCTFPSVAVSEECEANEDMCDTMDSCFYRTAGAGRWFHAAESTRCVSNCTHPLVFCDKGRCASTMGCSWFIKSQANVDQCYCIDNPGLNGNPPAKPRMTWIFWDQPVSIPIFVIACIAVIGIAYNVWLFNLKPFFARVFKRKPKE